MPVAPAHGKMRVKIKEIIVFLLFSTQFCHALAEDWTLVGTGTGVGQFVNLQSIEQVGKDRKAWTMEQYKEDQQRSDGAAWKVSKSLHYFACKQRKYALVEFSLYRSNPFIESDRIFQLSLKPTEVKFEQVPPGTLIDLVYKRVCK
jgi:hypothetical protein